MEKIKDATLIMMIFNSLNKSSIDEILSDDIKKEKYLKILDLLKNNLGKGVLNSIVDEILDKDW